MHKPYSSLTSDPTPAVRTSALYSSPDSTVPCFSCTSAPCNMTSTALSHSHAINSPHALQAHRTHALPPLLLNGTMSGGVLCFIYARVFFCFRTRRSTTNVHKTYVNACEHAHAACPEGLTIRGIRALKRPLTRFNHLKRARLVWSNSFQSFFAFS